MPKSIEFIRARAREVRPGETRRAKCAVVIPCYRVTEQIAGVLSSIGPEVGHIICVDDACPDKSGEFIRSHAADPRIDIITHTENQGVGGAVITGYRRALELEAEIVVKLDGDGQMDPSLIPMLISPIVNRLADYTKGNRFYDLSSISRMPLMRRLGNAFLSLITKTSSGYWNLFDPTNGFTAIHTSSLKKIALDQINKRFFFESDMLYQLNIIRSVIIDVPMNAVYAGETSNLSIRREIFRFAYGNFKNFFKRFFYNYLLRDFNLASVLALIGLPLLVFGAVFGFIRWLDSIDSGVPATAGTVMVAALPIIIGLEMLLSALSFDFSNVPDRPLCRLDLPPAPESSAPNPPPSRLTTEDNQPRESH